MAEGATAMTIQPIGAVLVTAASAAQLIAANDAACKWTSPDNKPVDHSVFDAARLTQPSARFGVDMHAIGFTRKNMPAGSLQSLD
jgi:hypothetical protein